MKPIFLYRATVQGLTFQAHLYISLILTDFVPDVIQDCTGCSLKEVFILLLIEVKADIINSTRVWGMIW
jgi:hypothetical protein